MNKILASVFVFQLTFASSAAKYENRCSTLSCVHSSATIIQKLNVDVDPCDDFYEYACGTFLEEQHTPDEKTTVDTIALMSDKLTEYLLTLLLKQADDDEPELHQLAKTLFNSCLNFKQINDRGKQPILNLMKALGGFPMLEGREWDESAFDWKATILSFRKYISKKQDDIFDGKELSNKIDTGVRRFVDDDADFSRIEKSLKNLIFAIVTSLNAEDSPELKSQIDEVIEFEKQLDEYQRTFKIYRKVFEPHFKNKTSGFKKAPKLQNYYKYVLYMNLLAPFILTNTSTVAEDSITIDFNLKFENFIENTPKRVIANYLFWRITQSSLYFFDKDLRNIVLTFEKEAFGKEDFEQRWVLCANIATSYAPVAIGSLYISQYFTEDDKQKAEQLVQYILDEYVETIKNSSWMDENTKARALDKSSKISRYIGYHSKLRSPEAEHFYDDLPQISDENFLEMGLAFLVLTTDREFKRLHAKKVKGEPANNDDWTKYSKPATVNAFYNSKDNSIQFPAAILQTPNFDKDRPPYMNFGAIGSIIGHEITHAFDDQASKIETWSEQSKKSYQERVQCIIDQYSSYRVKAVEDYYADENIGKFYLNGNFTQKEDIADCGGIKLALYALKNFEKKFPEAARVTPIGLQDYSRDKLFWLSFAQTFCSVERPPRMKNKVESDNHTLDRFRVIGAISNMQEFAEAWNCPEGSKMNPKKKCALW